MCCFSIGECVGPPYWKMTKLSLDIGLLVWEGRGRGYLVRG